MSSADGNPASTSLQPARRAWLFAALSIPLLLALDNLPLLTGNAAPQWDAANYFGPQFALVADEARSGHLLKWNPWAGAGSPDWTEPQFGTTSPVLLAAGLLSVNPQEGYIAYWLAVWAFGGIGMLLLARHLRCPVWGGAIAALGFVASGFYTGHAEHMPYVCSMSFLPWILWRLDAGLLERDWWCGVQAGFLYGLSALGGYPAFTIVTPGFLFLWVIGKMLWRDSGAPGDTRRPGPVLAVVLLLLTLGVGGIILSPSYAGFLGATRGFSDRIGPRPRSVAISEDPLEAGAISTVASPYLAILNIPPKGPWPRTDISMTSVYAGAASLVLALFGWRRRSGWRWWLVLMGVFFACCALGGQLPVRGWLYDYVPPTRYFRHAALFRGYLIFVIAILAALATRDLAAEPVSAAERRRLWRISILAACSSAVCFAVVLRAVRARFPELVPPAIHVVVVWFGFAALAYAVKLRRLSMLHFLRLAAALALLDAAYALHISRLTLYSAAAVPLWHEMNAGHNGSLDLSSNGLARLMSYPPDWAGLPNNRNLLPKISVFDSYITMFNRFQQELVADPLLSRMALGADRFWFSSEAAWHAPDYTSFQLFRARVHELAGQPILVVHSPQQMLALPPADAPAPVRQESSEPLNAPACIPAPVSDVSYYPDSLSLRYVAPRPGYLLVTDRWADGWEATVNGRRQPVLGADFLFRAVPVETGANRIAFVYQPRWFLPLVGISWSTLALVAGWQCRRTWRARKVLPVAV
jgi:hypothetical protein